MIAIAADEVTDMAALQTKLAGVTLLTADRRLPSLTAWGVLETGDEHPIPATFVVGRDGVVRWRHVLNPGGDWPTYDAVVKAVSAPTR